jgi:opacity protein-like surface antigen
MRRLLVAAVLVTAIATHAPAQEYELPTLRRSNDFGQVVNPALPRWDGFYLGGQVGADVGSMDFSTSTRDLVAHLLRELALENVANVSSWQVLGKADPTAGSFGAFVGYSIGWESLILGFELNYSRTDLSGSAPVSPISRATSAGGNDYFVTVTGEGSMRIKEVATLRARAGWDAGIVLPYAMIGAAVGRADISRTATVFGEENPAIPCDASASPPCTPFYLTQSESKSDAFIYGWSLGAGIDVMLMSCLFLRAEYEYVAFAPIWDMKSQLQTGRLGLGYKF